MKMRTLRTGILGGVGLTVVIVGGVMQVSGGGAPAHYDHDFQKMFGRSADFHVSGPATGPSPDVESDAFVDMVEYPSGDLFYFFYKPVDIFDIEYVGDRKKWKVKGGDRTTVGLSGEWKYKDETDESFAALILEAFRNNNLNNYLDLNSSDDDEQFSFTMAFDRVVFDNDPGPDDFGEILYFERGTGFGNSWLKFQAVDKDGNALGPWLVVGPNETVQTSPHTTIMRTDQKMGTTSIDISRLGVSELEYLRVSNDVQDEPAYNPAAGGDFAPDFKIMVVVTHPVQLHHEILGIFD